MSNQLNDCLMEPLCSLKKAVARLWSPKPPSANLNSTAANRTVDLELTLASEVPANPAAHQVTMSHDQVEHHVEGTGDRSRNGLCSPKISPTVTNKCYIVTPSVYPPTSTTYPSNLPIERGLATADDDYHALNHQSANIGTTNTDISTTVPLNAEISLPFSTTEMAVAGAISLTFLLMQSISTFIS